MPNVPIAIAEDRALSVDEREMLQFLLSRGDERAQDFAKQIDISHVVSRCGCGCASVDFHAADSGGLEQLGDEYFWLGPSGGICAVFAFARKDFLAGLETYSVDGVETAVALPSVKELRREPSGFHGG
jgi:hypothetical protein